MNAMAGFDDTPDGADRVADFLARHGGASQRSATAETHNAGLAGRSQIYAADGYTLRCDWSQTGNQKELNFTEIPPDRADRTGAAIEN
jgi:hypothetical protein